MGNRAKSNDDSHQKIKALGGGSKSSGVNSDGGSQSLKAKSNGKSHVAGASREEVLMSNPKEKRQNAKDKRSKTRPGSLMTTACRKKETSERNNEQHRTNGKT